MAERSRIHKVNKHFYYVQCVTCGNWFPHRRKRQVGGYFPKYCADCTHQRLTINRRKYARRNRETKSVAKQIAALMYN